MGMPGTFQHTPLLIAVLLLGAVYRIRVMPVTVLSLHCLLHLILVLIFEIVAPYAL